MTSRSATLPPDCLERDVDARRALRQARRLGDTSRMVIPHGTAWGILHARRAPSWRQAAHCRGARSERGRRLVEIYSGHGNSEDAAATGARWTWRAGRHAQRVRAPAFGYLPSVLARRRAGGSSAASRSGESEGGVRVVAPPTRSQPLRRRRTRRGCQDAVQGETPPTTGAERRPVPRRTCFQPAFNFRPRSSSVQYMHGDPRLLSDAREPEALPTSASSAASDNAHRAVRRSGLQGVRARRDDGRTAGGWKAGPRAAVACLGSEPDDVDEPGSPSRCPSCRAARVRSQLFGVLETERLGSYFVTGGLVGGARRAGAIANAIWDALEAASEVYATSGRAHRCCGST